MLEKDSEQGYMLMEGWMLLHAHIEFGSVKC